VWVRYESPDHNGHLVDGEEFAVLEIYVEHYRDPPAVSFRLDDGEGTPALYDAFQVVDGSIPEGWTVSIGAADRMVLGPSVWQRWSGQYSFWEDFTSGDPDVARPAWRAYESELERIRHRTT
jgi:hypothetical protein